MNQETENTYIATYDDTLSSTQGPWLTGSLIAVSTKTYEIDWEKVKSPEDLLKVMRTMRIEVAETSPHFEQVKQFCKGIENG